MWVFGYGSLIWDPGFTPARRAVARLDGWHRSFCMRSIHYRGTPEAPGLVLALDRLAGAFCDGVAFEVRAGEEAEVHAYLHQRELISDAYLEEVLSVEVAGVGRVQAVTYVIDHAHPQYVAGLSAAAQADIIAVAKGTTGTNRDYLANTVRHLAALGITDPDLSALAADVDRITGGGQVRQDQSSLSNADRRP